MTSAMLALAGLPHFDAQANPVPVLVLFGLAVAAVVLVLGSLRRRDQRRDQGRGGPRSR